MRNGKQETKTLFSKGACEFDRVRLEIGIKTMFSGNQRICVWKTSPDGEMNRGEVAYYNLYTGHVSISLMCENYPEIDFEMEMKNYAEDPEDYDSLYNDDCGSDTEKLVDTMLK